MCYLSLCIVNLGEAILDSEVVYPKFHKFWLHVIGHFKTLSEVCSRIELLEVRDDMLVHGLVKRCGIRG